jgi:hypothetical protein
MILDGDTRCKVRVQGEDLRDGFTKILWLGRPLCSDETSGGEVMLHSL